MKACKSMLIARPDFYFWSVGMGTLYWMVAIRELADEIYWRKIYWRTEP